MTLAPQDIPFYPDYLRRELAPEHHRSWVLATRLTDGLRRKGHTLAIHPRRYDAMRAANEAENREAITLRLQEAVSPMIGEALTVVQNSGGMWHAWFGDGHSGANVGGFADADGARNAAIAARARQIVAAMAADLGVRILADHDDRRAVDNRAAMKSERRSAR